MTLCRFTVSPPTIGIQLLTNPMTIQSDQVYGLSTDSKAFDAYKHQNHYALRISRKACQKIGITTSNQFSHKTFQSAKPSFKITFIKFYLFRKYFKNRFTTLVYKIIFKLKIIFSILRFSIYQIIIKISPELITSKVFEFLLLIRAQPSSSRLHSYSRALIPHF